MAPRDGFAINNRTPRIPVFLNSDVAGYPQKVSPSKGGNRKGGCALRRLQLANVVEAFVGTVPMQATLTKTSPAPISSLRAAARGHHSCLHVSCRLAVSEGRLASPNFNNVTTRIADVAVSSRT